MKIYLAKIISGSIYGTAFMTIFSYLISGRRQNHFKKPMIFNLLLGRVDPLNDLKKGKWHKKSWMAHYLAGLFFSFLFSCVWSLAKTEPNLKSGSLLGAINGLIGICIWRILFNIHPKPPEVKPQKYYGHILGAHIIFGIFTAFGYKKATDT
ncbi:MAG: hypothetical protein ACNS60_06585 [Candidatus Cyclobacteriaceae bacterium M2_1C_046]